MFGKSLKLLKLRLETYFCILSSETECIPANNVWLVTEWGRTVPCFYGVCNLEAAEIKRAVLWQESTCSCGSTCSLRREGIRECSSFSFDLHTNPVKWFGVVILCLQHHEEVVPNKLNLIQDCRARTRIQDLLASFLSMVPLCALQFLLSDN